MVLCIMDTLSVIVTLFDLIPIIGYKTKSWSLKSNFKLTQSGNPINCFVCCSSPEYGQCDSCPNGALSVLAAFRFDH